MLKNFSSLYPRDILAWLFAVTVFGVIALAGLLVGLRHPRAQRPRDLRTGLGSFE